MAEKTDITRNGPPEALERDIERTRQEMSGTVSEIQNRLSYGHLKEQAKETIRESTANRVNKMKNAATRMGQSVSQTARDTGSTIVDTIRNNPVPVIMISAGVAWLVFNRTRGGNSQLISQKASELSGKAGELTGKAQEKMSELSGQAKEAGSEFASRASESASRFSRAAQEQAKAATSSLQQMLNDNPLGVTLASFGIGALVGFLIPETRQEREAMGSASETLLTRAKEAAQKTFQKAEHAAERAVQTAQEEFKKEAA